MATPGLQTLCQLIQQQLWVQSPANAVKQVRYSQVAPPANAFGSGGSNLVVVNGLGNAVATQIVPVPPGVRSILLRNLSATKTLIYWTGPSQTPPSSAYSTLPANGTVAIDIRADVLDGLWFMPDPTSTDAGLEALMTYFDPTKAPGPQVAPFTFA